MDVIKATKIISALANGVDPETGEILPEDGPYQNPDTIRALFLALKGLKVLESRGKRSNNLPTKAGKPWLAEEDEELSKAFDTGLSAKELSLKHARTVGAIQSRLIKLGKTELEVLGEEKEGNTLPSRTDKLWSSEEDEELIKAFDASVSVKELSLKFGRTMGAIQSRLIMLGKKVF